MVLLDTNILLRHTDPKYPEHPAVAALLESLAKSGESFCTCAQTLAELWAVLTRPAHANGIGMEPVQARQRVDTITAFWPLVPDPPGMFTTWLDICTAHQVRGRQVYDARLVALMVACGIRQLVTLNAVDFARYPMIELLVPGQPGRGPH